MLLKERTANVPEITQQPKKPRRNLPPIIKLGGGLALVGALLTGCGSSNSNKPEASSAATASSSPAPSSVAPKPGPAVLLEGSHHTETEQFGAPTFTDYTHAYGPGPRLAIGEQVDVDCLATGPVEAAPTVKGKWYHIQGPAALAGYYAAANTFENGDTSGPLSSQPAVDAAVPACPTS